MKAHGFSITTLDRCDIDRRVPFDRDGNGATMRSEGTWCCRHHSIDVVARRNSRSRAVSCRLKRTVRTLALWVGQLLAAIVWMAAVAAAQQPAAVDAPQGGLGIVEAVQLTLRENPIFHIQERQVDFNRGALLTAQSLFDTTLGASVQQGRVYTPLTHSEVLTALAAGIDTASQNTNATSTSLTAQKLFPSGYTLGTSVSLTRNTDNLINMPGLNNSQVSVQLTIPLLRNRGREVVTAQEDAARLEIDASTYDVSQLASQLITGTATTYWQYLGALRSLAVQNASEERGRQLLANVQELIRADQLPRLDTNTAVANAASRSASRVAAEQAVVQAGQSLALAIGLSPDVLLSLRQPTDPFPDGLEMEPMRADPESLKALIHQTLERRADHLAANKRVRELERQLVAATNQLKPQLDLAVNAGYAGLQESDRIDRYLASLFQNVHGPNVTGNVIYQFPYENRQARGRVAETQATLQQAQLKLIDVDRTIGSSIVVAVQALNNSIQQLKNAKVAADAFRDALAGQQDRLRLGVGSVIDILQFEDRYISSDLQFVQAQVEYASAIANLRFATGTYLDPDTPVQPIRRELFFIPAMP